MARLLDAYDIYRCERTKGGLRAFAERWRAENARRGASGYDAPLVEDATPMVAYVNHGRWLVDCTCRNGVPVTPVSLSKPEAVCLSCGTVWTSISLPGDLAAVERALLDRARDVDRNWQAAQSAEDLRRENIEQRIRLRVTE